MNNAAKVPFYFRYKNSATFTVPSSRIMLDKEDFEILFKSQFKVLCFFAMKYLKDYENSREVVQDVFLKLWEKRDDIDTAKSLKSYLGTSVRNKCINYLRDHKKFNHDLLLLEDLSSDMLAEPADKLVEADIRDRIAEAISELPEKCREIFLLSRNEHLKYQEIADQLDISVKTVEAQMSKALQHMRQRLKEFLMIAILIIPGVIN
jgi:RNA polymerase sigma-70 factor, ECF subfamily